MGARVRLSDTPPVGFGLTGQVEMTVRDVVLLTATGLGGWLEDERGVVGRWLISKPVSNWRQ